MKRFTLLILTCLLIATSSFAAIQLRRDTAANWTSNNPTLASGEVGVETDTAKQKIGNGSTTWTSLAYVGAAELNAKRSIADERKEIGWLIKDSDVVTAVADGKQAAVIPANMNGMLLVDLTCSVSNLNSAASGDTTVVLRRVRGATPVDMTSTGVTIAYTDYTASDEVVDTANDDVATGDKIFVDVNSVTSEAQKGLGCTAVFSNP